jgi:hypothetical protein
VPAGGPTRNRWWNRVTKSIVTSIVTLGAVAGAIGTIVSLWPSPDADDSAEVAVRIVPGVPLSEYQRRVESTGVIALKSYSPPDEEATTEPTTGAEPSETMSPTPTGGPEPTGAPTSTGSDPDPDPTSAPTADTLVEPTEGSIPTALGTLSVPGIDVDPPAGSDAVNDEEIDHAYQQLSGGDPVPSDFIAIGSAIGPGGEPVDPAVAAERIARVLADARHGPSATDPGASGPEPLGVVVSTDLDLSGLRGKVLTLSWSMWQEAGEVRLSGDWLNDNLAYRIEPRTDHATTTLDVWIPMPREPGSYFVRVDLRSGLTRVDSGESDRFE